MSDEEFVLTEAPEYDAIPDGEILAAEVVSVEVKEAPWEDKNTGQKAKRVNFRFVITEEGAWQGRTIFGETPTTFTTHPDCKLRVWIQEILGSDDLGDGFRFKPSALDGMPVRIAANQRERKAADGSTQYKNYVGDVIRANTVKTASDLF